MEKLEKVIETKDEAVQTDNDIDEDSSDSIYSYSMCTNEVALHQVIYVKTLKVIIEIPIPGYQDESSHEIEVVHRRIPFKDVEAQKIKEDVTIQVRYRVLYRKDLTPLY